jgi:hypothetical protein
MREWRKNTSSSANAVLTITCRMNSGSASCRLTPMRVLTSWPMSTAWRASERPKSSANSETERSHRMVLVSFARPPPRVPVQRLVVAALGLPLLDLLLRDALAADVQPRHVVGRVDGEEQEEGEEVDADQDQQAVAERRIR